VPLSVYPGTGQDGNDRMVNLIDVYATVLDATGVETSNIRHRTRGESLLNGIEPRDTVSEFHGLSRLHVQSLDEDWMERVRYMDVELDAIASPPTYYGYETFDGFEEYGETQVSDTRQRLNELIDEKQKRETEQENYNDMSDEVLDRLEDLGYA